LEGSIKVEKEVKVVLGGLIGFAQRLGVGVGEFGQPYRVGVIVQQSPGKYFLKKYLENISRGVGGL